MQSMYVYHADLESLVGHEFKDPFGKAGTTIFFQVFVNSQLLGLTTVMYSNHSVLQRQYKTIREVVKLHKLGLMNKV